MSEHDPVKLLFGGMAKLGPGSDAHTLRMLRLLPARRFELVVDAGCGSGRQTLALARELGVPIHAVDSHRPFLEELARRATDAGLDFLVRATCMDMREIPEAFQNIDLLWSEGAAYNIGFGDALTRWRPAMRADGFVVVSELAWLRDSAPAVAKEFFLSGYPDMRHTDENVAIAERAGYKVLTVAPLPRETWVEDYYEVLAPRAKALADHPDAAVRDFAEETLREIEVFNRSDDSYGYVFYALQSA
jgi:cyclopropane fatty-acyl-phospholipid synthase-like methyltransferase